MTLVPAYDGAVLAPIAASDEEQDIHRRIDEIRSAMEAQMLDVRERCVEYLNWYSPPYDTRLRRHDAWDDEISLEDITTGVSRSNYPICRAVVDIWAALEAAKPPSSRAEPERIPAPPPMFDEITALRVQRAFAVYRGIESRRADLRSWVVRTYRRRDDFPLKHFRATRRKDLYGFTWVKVLPGEGRPVSHVVKNPTTVFPIWSTRDPDDVEMILCAYQENASVANARYGLGLEIDQGGHVIIGKVDSRYRKLEERWYDEERTMVWLEECWWIDRRDGGVSMGLRACGQLVEKEHHADWRKVPFVAFQNTDERDSYGWSDIAGAMDINDEINQRLSQQGDIIGMFSAPRFQLLGAVLGVQRTMPKRFGLISLSDTERIEQILTRIDVYPTGEHISALLDLLSRVTGLPPIVWGLINNAQTSGRALSASWKATEARLAPKLMENEHALRRWDGIALDYLHAYDWMGARRLFLDRHGERFEDFHWAFPPMEPRDYQEVTMNAINKRDSKLITTIQAMREAGDEAAEDTMEEVLAEWSDGRIHPDAVQAQELLRNARLQNDQLAASVGQPVPGAGGVPQNPATVAQAIGAAAQAGPAAQGQLPAGPPPQAGPPGGPGGSSPSQVTSGTLMRGGEVSNQYLRTTRYG